MRHQKHRYQLGVKPSHRKSMMKNLAISFFEHGQIKSTRARCKALQVFAERLITLARTDSVANRRLVYSRLNSKKAVKNLFESVGPLCATRPGGYTRYLRHADQRTSDGAQMAFLSLVDRKEVEAKVAGPAKTSKEEASKKDDK